MNPHETNTKNPVDFPKVENTKNELIQTLVDQATETVDVSKKLGMSGTDLVFNKEKFAELIVQECIRCCEDVDVIQKHYLKYGIDQELGAGHCIEVIKKHFGIDN